MIEDIVDVGNVTGRIFFSLRLNVFPSSEVTDATKFRCKPCSRPKVESAATIITGSVKSESHCLSKVCELHKTSDGVRYNEVPASVITGVDCNISQSARHAVYEYILFSLITCVSLCQRQSLPNFPTKLLLLFIVLHGSFRLARKVATLEISF